MKSDVLPLLSVVLLLGVSSCGKKLQDGKTEAPRVAINKAEAQFKANTELLRAVESGRAEKVDEILRAHSVDLDQTFNNGETLLTTAIKFDHLSVRNILLEKGARVQKANFNGESPLMVAVVNNRLNSVKVLLDRKVDVDQKDNAGMTALHRALKLQGDQSLKLTFRKAYEDLAILLIKSGASVTESYGDGKMDAQKLVLEFPNERLLEIIRNIVDVELGAPDIVTFKNTIVSGDTKNLSLLLTKFPNLVTSYESINPLVLGIEIKEEMAAYETVRLLLASRTDVNGPREAMETPLIKSVKVQKISFARLLLEGRANPHLQDREGKSALYHAIEQVDLEFVELLLNHASAKEYDFYKNGVKMNFRACKLAESVRQKLKDKKIISKLETIKKRLDCSTSFFSFL